MATVRETWAKRVRRLEESELTAAEFAAELGVNANTLSHWRWRLRKEAGTTTGRRRSKARPAKTTFVEVAPAASSWWSSTERVEVVLDERHVVRVPDGFDPETLRQVLEVVRARG